MNFFKNGDKVQLKGKTALRTRFEFAKESGVVVGNGFLQSGVPCLILSMNGKDLNGILHDYLLVPMDSVEPLG